MNQYANNVFYLLHIILKYCLNKFHSIKDINHIYENKISDFKQLFEKLSEKKSQLIQNMQFIHKN